MLCKRFASEKELKVKKNIKLFPKISDREFWENSKESTISFFEKNVGQYNPKARGNILRQLCTENFI